MHREYLREVHPSRLNTLILTGELWTYLADLNEQAQERLDTIMEQMKATEGDTCPGVGTGRGRSEKTGGKSFLDGKSENKCGKICRRPDPRL